MTLRYSFVAILIALLTLATNTGYAKGPDPVKTPRHIIDALQQLENLPPGLEFEPGVIVVKFREHTSQQLFRHSVGVPSIAPLLAEFGIHAVEQMYPLHKPVLMKNGATVALDRMYRLEFSSGADPLAVAKAFARNTDIEYAEPEVIHYLSYIPNDPMYSEQYMHQRIQSELAWDITKGDKNVVIGIVDSGVNWHHEDLADNIWINPGEDIDHDGKHTAADDNGIDDDGNGYIDDIKGIDFIGDGKGTGTYYDNDPQPTPDGNPHGTHVAGIAAGAGDNGKGIAGVAYRCSIMPVKCGTDVSTPRISRGYDGIVYAADNGAKVINCSWGGGGYLASQEEHINYAISKGALVVAAAGNNGYEVISTPGAYPNVLCVANTDQDDKVAPSSTYGPWVDVSAPGSQILSSVSNDDSSYQKFTGTSMASPVVAGLAALVCSQHPEYTPMQVGEQIRVTAEDIDNLQPVNYRQKIGKGRVNAHRALTVSSPAVRMIEWSFTDSLTGDGNHILTQGETFTVRMTWQNLLAPASDVTVTLSSPNPRVTIQNPVFHIGALGTMQTANNAAAPFIVDIADEYAPNDKIDLIYVITDGEYQDKGGVYVIQQPTYRNHDVNKILVTLSNDGNIGYDDFNGMRGSGFVYNNNGADILFEGAFMLGARLFGSPTVVDVARDESGRAQCSDFLGSRLFEMFEPGQRAPQQGRGEWTDINVPLERRLFLNISLDSYEFTQPGHDNYIILKYTIRNEYDSDYPDVYPGLFFDWDISSNAYSDWAGYDPATRTGFALDSSRGIPTCVGMAVLSNDSLTNFWALENGSPDDSLSIGIYNGFTKDDKWKSLTSGTIHPEAGVSDVSTIISNGPYVLKAMDSLIVGFVLSAGNTVEDVLATTPIARVKWDSLMVPFDPSPVQPMLGQPETMEILSVYPQPFNRGALTVAFSTSALSQLSITLVDALGRTAAVLDQTRMEAGRHTRSYRLPILPPGMYRIVLKTATGMISKPVLITR